MASIPGPVSVRSLGWLLAQKWGVIWKPLKLRK
jgi:hypothetical protein